MQRRSVRRRAIGASVATATALSALVGLTGTPVDAVGHEEAATYTVTFTNRTSGQWMTPPNLAIHDRRHDIFDPWRPASPGVQAVAENGGVQILAAELDATIDQPGHGDSTVGGAAPVGPGESVSFEITSDADRVSLVSMLICTNDGFAGVDSRRLPRRDGQTRSYWVRAYDAGTEVNTERRDDLVPAPFCGEDGGTDMSDPELAENGVIRRHRTIRGIGDLDESFDWRGPVARLTIERH